MKNKTLFFVAGERSGDLHAGNLIKSLLRKEEGLTLIGWGGDYMKEAGMNLLRHYREIAFMGIWEVIKNLRKARKFLEECKEEILQNKPDAVVLVDYGGFNLKIAKFCKENNIPVKYYISPKVWAWNTKRAYKIKEVVEDLYCIMPFEPEFFKKYDFKTTYVGNPVLDEVKKFKSGEENTIKSELDIVAILPGSRKQEVVQMLDLMVEISKSFSEYKFIVTAVDNLDDELYDIARNNGIDVLYNETYKVLNSASVALVTSGTATLETALFNVPQAICYKTSKLTYRFGKMVLKIPYISLVNLIADKEVVKELIQDDFNSERIKQELTLLLKDIEYRKKIQNGYNEVSNLLGDKSASENTADLILNSI